MMRSSLRLLVGAVAVGTPLLLATPASAQTCDYPFDCSTGVNPKVVVKAPSTVTNGRGVASTGSTAATLPFTGGEVVVMSLAGATAVAAGGALVVAGRRRTVQA